MYDISKAVIISKELFAVEARRGTGRMQVKHGSIDETFDVLLVLFSG
jgi:hypothetical protein